MNGSSPNQLFLKSWQRPGNLAMMASVVAHGFLFAGLALVPATGQQTAKKQLRVVSLLQTPPDQPANTNQPIDPNAPPPAPGVAGLPLNITTPEGLAELPVTNTPNPAFDPFASSVVELPPSSQTSLPPVNPGPPVTPLPPQPASSPDAAAQSQNAQQGPSLSDEDFQDWLNGTTNLPNLPPDPGANSPLTAPGETPGAVASSGNIRPNSANGIGSDLNSNSLGNPATPGSAPTDDPNVSIAPPRETVERFLAYDYPQAACEEQLEGKAEYRIWVSSQATPVVSDIVLSTNSDVLDRAVKVAAQKYKITAEDANKLVVLPFEFKYSQKTCEAKETPSPSPNLDPDPSSATPAPTPPTPKPTEPEDENTEPKDENKDDPQDKDSPSPSPSLKLPDAPQIEKPVQPTQPPQPVVPQPSPLNQPQLSPPAVQQPPAAPTPIPAPVPPAVPLKAPPSNSDVSPSVPPTDPGPAKDVKPATTNPPTTGTTPPVVDDSAPEATPPVIDNSEAN